MCNWRFSLLWLAMAVLALPAAQIEPRQVTSPMTGQPFHIDEVPVTSGGQRVLGKASSADMGTDSDGCRHDSGASEYDYYIATCPYTYFSALSVEWRPDGRFASALAPELKQWLTGPNGFHTEWVTDRERYYKRATTMAKAQGGTLPPRDQWVIPQGMIEVSKRYRFALECYAKRGAPPSMMARIALNGAWAVRVDMNRPLVDSRLKGGIEEVNLRLQRYVSGDQGFELETWYKKLIPTSSPRVVA